MDAPARRGPGPHRKHPRGWTAEMDAALCRMVGAGLSYVRIVKEMEAQGLGRRRHHGAGGRAAWAAGGADRAQSRIRRDRPPEDRAGMAGAAGGACAGLWAAVRGGGCLMFNRREKIGIHRDDLSSLMDQMTNVLQMFVDRRHARMRRELIHCRLQMPLRFDTTSSHCDESRSSSAESRNRFLFRWTNGRSIANMNNIRDGKDLVHLSDLFGNHRRREPDQVLTEVPKRFDIKDDGRLSSPLAFLYLKANCEKCEDTGAHSADATDYRASEAEPIRPWHRSRPSRRRLPERRVKSGPENHSENGRGGGYGPKLRKSGSHLLTLPARLSVVERAAA